MKKLFTILAILSAGQLLAAEWRVVDGRIIDVSTNKAWREIEAEYSRLDTAGNILAYQLVAKQVPFRLEMSPYTSSGRLGGGGPVVGSTTQMLPGPMIRIVGYPKRKAFETGEKLKFHARAIAIVQVGSEMAQQFDYGVEPTSDELKVHFSDIRRQQLENRAARLANIAEQQKADAAAALPRVVANQLRNASNGFAYAQYELGLRYSKGDGVPVDPSLALHWLRSACTNGHSQASNALKQIAKQP